VITMEKIIIGLILVALVFGCISEEQGIMGASQDDSPDLSAPQDVNFQKHVQAYFIGQPNLGELVAMDSIAHRLTYRIKESGYLSTASIADLNGIDIIIIDKRNESVTVPETDALLSEYLSDGGKIISILTLNELMPVGCYAPENMPIKCSTNSITSNEITGRVYKQDSVHPIVIGSEDIIPNLQGSAQNLTVLSVQPKQDVNNLAYIKSEDTPQTFPAVVEKNGVVYFNYDPGVTTRIFTDAILYLGGAER